MTYYEKLSLLTEFLIFLATAMYVIFAGGQWYVIRKTMLLTQRSRLRVRNISVAPVPTTATNPHQLTSQPVTVTFSLSNVGGVIARVCVSHCVVYMTSNPLPMQPTYAEDPPNNLIGNRSLKPGEIHHVSLSIKKPMDDHKEGTWQVHFQNLYVMGYTDYADALNVMRRTAFCRRLAVTAEGRRYFVAEENPDYEYED